MSNTLRRLSFLALLSVFMAVPGCATTSTPDGGTPTPTPTPTQAFGTCSSDAIKKTGESLIGQITTALATGDYEAEITKLLVTYTAAEIGCGVDLIAAQFKLKAARTNDTETQVVLAHAEAWRQAHPAQ